jgi:hypothetical protein
VAEGQRLWDWTHQVADAGKEALAQASSWGTRLLATAAAGPENPSHKIDDSPADTAKAYDEQDSHSSIEELMQHSRSQRSENIRGRKAVKEHSLHALRLQVKRDPSTLQKILDRLDPNGAASLDTALGLMAKAAKVTFIQGDGSSHLLTGAAVEAARLGSQRALQEIVETLGPITAISLKADASMGGEDSFKYDLRRFYSPDQALSDEQLDSLPTLKTSDTVDFLAGHRSLLEALIRGMSSKEWSAALPYLGGGLGTRNLQKRLAGHGGEAARIVDALLSRSGLNDDQRHILILREFLGQSKNEISEQYGHPFYSIPYKVDRAISHLVAVAKHAPSDSQSTVSPLELQQHVQERKKETARFFQDQEQRTMEGLVTGHSPYSSMKDVQAALRKGTSWTRRHWSPKGEGRRNVSAPRETALYLELLYPPAKKLRVISTSPRKIRLSNHSYEALTSFVRSSGKMWDTAEISALYKLFRGVAPLIEITDLKRKTHLVRTATALGAMFNEWGVNSPTQADVELFETSGGDDEAFYRQGKRALKEAIEKGMAWLAEKDTIDGSSP